MDLSDAPAQADFRARLRAWLDENVPTDPEPATMSARFDYMRAFQRKLYEGGWVALSYPKQFGGQGLGPLEEAILSQELARANAPATLPLGHLGRPLLSHGSAEQRQRYLPRLLDVSEIWCQGFSEPDAGSDLAGMRTTAMPDGDGYRVDGQKLWTSYGAFADLCLLLARSEPDAGRHRGISAFILPLDTPGVTVRPVVLANGDEEFAEVFLDGVWLAGSQLLGERGQGWEIAMETIAHERGAADTGYIPKFERFLTDLARQIERDGGDADDAVRERVGRLAAGLDVLTMHTLRRLAARSQGSQPGFEFSIDKLLMTSVEQDLLQGALDLTADFGGPHMSTWFDRYVFARAASIYGGTSQIQKNILSTRLLGLPR